MLPLPLWARRALATIAQRTLWLLSAVAALLFVAQIVVSIVKGSVETQMKRWDESNKTLANKAQQLTVAYPQWAFNNSFSNGVNSSSSPFRPDDPAKGMHWTSLILRGAPFPDRQHFAVAATSTEDCMNQCTDGCWGVTYFGVKRLCERFSSVDGKARADANDRTEIVVWSRPEQPPNEAPATQWNDAPDIAFMPVRGDPLWRRPTRNPDLCKGACDGVPSCQGFTWFQPGGFCMLFTSMRGRDRRTSPGSFSATKVLP